MEYAVEFLDDGGPVDVTIALSGELTPSSFRELVAALSDDPRYRSGLALLVDISALHPYDIPDEMAREFTAPVLARDWEYPPRAVAIIAPDDELFATAVTYRAHLGGTMSRRHVVRTRAEAVDWLERQR